MFIYRFQMRGEKKPHKLSLWEENTLLLHCNCTGWFDSIVQLPFVLPGWELALFLSLISVDLLRSLSLLFPFHLLSTVLPRSQNHKMVGVVSDLWRPLSPTPLTEQVYLGQVAQEHV